MGLFEDIDALGLTRGYQQYVIALEPVLEAMSKRGIPVSPAEHTRVSTTLTQQLVAASARMQQLVPDEIKQLQPARGYLRTPRNTQGMVQRWFHEDGKVDELRWVKLKPWSPSGGAKGGLVRYMKYKKHPVPRAFKTDKETTAELELRRLAKSTRDPLYVQVIEYRELQTLLTNHVKNWIPCEPWNLRKGSVISCTKGVELCNGGRVHPTFYYDTGTGQLGARRPNSMNAPRHKANQGDIFRSMIVAKEGHTLVELDYKAFHVQTLAFEAGDADLLRLAKLDIHSFLTAHFLRLPIADKLTGLQTSDLRDELQRVKRDHKAVRDAKVKHALLGYNNGMGYRKCYYQYMEFFDGQNESKRIFELLDSLFPKAKDYRKRVCDLAHSQGYLISRFGCIRWFWEVFKWTGGKWSYGDDHEAALSFFTQNDAHCHLKDAMLRLAQHSGIKFKDGTIGVYVKNQAERFGLINPIHDALMFECPDSLLEEAVPELKQEMERPSEVLVNEVAPGGLVVEVAASIGKSWNRMKEVT